MSGLILDLFGFPMGSPIPYRIAPVLPARPPVTAGTHEAEGVASDAVAARTAVRNAEPAALDDDRVKHFEWLRRQGEKHYLPQAEFERQARLRRWQEQR